MRALLLTLIVLFLFSNNVLAAPKDKIDETQTKKTIFLGGIDLSKNEFSSETRLGVSYATGNTNSLTLNGGNDTKYRYKRWANMWSLGARYERVFSSTQGTNVGTGVNYFYGIYRLDYYFKPYLSTFIGGSVYGNRIKGVEIAGEGFGGLQFLFINTKNTSLSFSLGYDYTYEDRLQSPNKQIHSALQEIYFKQKLTKTAELTQNIKVLENIQDGRDVRVNAKTAINVKMNEHLSLIVGFKILFDNQPVPGYKKLDTFSDLALGITF